MIKRIAIYFIVSVVFGLIFYYLTNNPIFSLATLLIYLVFFMSYYEIKYRKYKITIRKTRECIQFINNFIITMSVNNSINTTFDSLSSSFSNELIEQINSINHLTDEEKIMYLENYFVSPLYSAFTKLLRQFIEEGGNIIDNTHLLIFDTRVVEEDLNNFISISYRKVFQFCIMWSICFLILIVTKTALGNYYSQIQGMSYFPFSIFLFFLVFLGSLWLILKHFLDLRFINKEIMNEKHKR